MAHELLLHAVSITSWIGKAFFLFSDASNQSAEIEIGAEIFAAELIYPEQMFSGNLLSMGVTLGSCTPQDLVVLKRETQTTLSYAGLAKRAEFLGFAPQGSLGKVAWKKLEESIYGVPFYKQRITRARGS